MYVYIPYTYTSMYTYLYIDIRIFIYIDIEICMQHCYGHIHIHIHTHMHINSHILMRIHASADAYKLCIYIYVRTYIHLCKLTHDLTWPTSHVWSHYAHPLDSLQMWMHDDLYDDHAWMGSKLALWIPSVFWNAHNDLSVINIVLVYSPSVNAALLKHPWVDLLPTNYQSSWSLLLYNVSQTLACKKTIYGMYFSMANLSVWNPE